MSSQHRPSSLHQSNKPFKGQRKTTKGELKRKNKGRVLERASSSSAASSSSNGGGGGGNTTKSSLKHGALVTKQQRQKAQQKQDALRNKKRDEMREERRLGSNQGPPKIVALVSLRESCENGTATATTRFVKDLLLIQSTGNGANDAADMTMEDEQLQSRNENYEFMPKTVILSDFKQRVTIMETKRNAHSVLDAAKVADVLILTIAVDSDDQEMVDKVGETMLALIRSQGVPSLIVALHGLSKIQNVKKQNDLKKKCTKWIKSQFPGSLEPRLVVCDAEADSRNLSRWIHEEKARKISWRERRSYMLVEKLNFVPKAEQQSTGTLVVQGYLRGLALSANQLVHLCNFGTYQIDKIVQPASGDPCPLSKSHRRDDGDAMMIGGLGDRVLDTPDSKQENLVSFLEPSELGNEQTWPTKEDMLNAMSSSEVFDGAKKLKKVPKGYSEYQASWVVDDDEDGAQKRGQQMNDDDVDEDDEEEEEEDEYEEDDVDDDDDDMMDDDAMAQAAEQAQRRDKMLDGEERHFQFADTQSVATTTNHDRMFSLDEDELMNEQERAAEREQYLSRMKDQQDEQDFPDEVETPLDTAARIRFQKYRGLKSLRHSPWDPKENLPIDYARVFQFENFENSQKLAYREHLKRSAEFVQPDTYVAIHIRDVPANFMTQFQKRCLNAESPESNMLLLFGMMRHEQKMSVVHLLVKKHTAYGDTPIKSKDPMYVQVGFRTFYTQPIYSEYHPRSAKARYERFLQPSQFMVATIYAPVTFRPAPVLMFNPKTGALAATGSIMSVDPDRVIMKRIVLTGYPYKVHKRQCVARFMFYSPEDVKWFRPVELRTKHGRIGIIREPLGTHGYMKCLFDDRIAGHDVICMNLYKRVYPKWHGNEQRSLLFGAL